MIRYSFPTVTYSYFLGTRKTLSLYLENNKWFWEESGQLKGRLQRCFMEQTIEYSLSWLPDTLLKEYYQLIGNCTGFHLSFKLKLKSGINFSWIWITHTMFLRETKLQDFIGCMEKKFLKNTENLHQQNQSIKMLQLSENS